MRKINSAFGQESVENHKTPSEAPRISVFPQDQTNWRIDWFGDIAFPDRSIRRKQPSVFIHLSRVIDDRFESDPTVLLSPQCTGPAKLQKRIWVSVGTLTLIRIGDIWRNGQLVCQPDYELEAFANVQIDRGSTSIVKAGLNLNDGGFLLPMGEHPWHMQCTKSYCLTVQLSQDRRMIIPCLELVRFYFGSSSNLLSKLFLPPLIRESLFSSASLDPKTRKLRIDLADKMSGASAADIGRISIDPVAARAARIVGASCLRASTTDTIIYPQALFPFEGITDLIASGKWLSHGETPNSTFLVYNLRSCSHPFPFRALQYTTKGMAPKAKTQPSQLSPVTTSPRLTRQATPNAANQALVEKDSSSSLARKTQNIWESPRFPDLEKKCIWRDKVLTPDESIGSAIGTTSSPIDSTAVGDESGSNRRVRPVDLEIVTRDAASKPATAPNFLQKTVVGLSHLKGITVELLTASQDDGWTVPISVLADEDGEISPKLMISAPDNALRMRRAAVFAFKRETEHICAVVIESDPLHTKIYTTTGLDAAEIWTTLKCAALDFVNDAHNEALDMPLTDLIELIFDGLTQ